MSETSNGNTGLLYRRRSSEPAVFSQQKLNRVRRSQRSSFSYSEKIQEEISENETQTTYTNVKNGTQPVGNNAKGRYSPPRTRRLSLESRFSEPGKKKLTFEQWCKMVHERMKRERLRKESEERTKGPPLAVRRTSITFEEWNHNIEMRKKLEELKIAEEQKKELEQKELEKMNHIKRKISFTEWLEQKSEKQSAVTAPVTPKQATSNDKRGRRSGIDSINIFDGSTLPRQFRRHSESSPPTATQVIPHPPADEKLDNEKMHKSREAFQKWMVKKELEAIKKEREELLKSRQLFSEYLKQNSSLHFPSLA